MRMICHVLPGSSYDLILGSKFLWATETLTKYRRRLQKCFFSILSSCSSHFNYLGEESQRLRGTIGDVHDVLAVPDTGADRNVMDMDYALERGFSIKNDEQYREYLQFADGSIQQTMGRVDTHWTFESGKRIPISFEVLENCCSDIIIGEEILPAFNVFEDHIDSITSIPSVADEYDLAPFDFIRTWQRPFQLLHQKFSSNRAKKPTSDRSNSSQSMLSANYDRQAEEQERLDVWNFEYDFGATASPSKRSSRSSEERATPRFKPPTVTIGLAIAVEGEPLNRELWLQTAGRR